MKRNNLLSRNNNDFVSDILSVEKIEHKKIVVSSQTDMNENFEFCDGFVAFDSEKIFIIKGKANSLDTEKVAKKKMLDFLSENISVVEGVNSLAIEKNITTCVLVAKTDLNEKQIAFFSFALLEKVSGFVETVNYFIKNRKCPDKIKEVKSKCVSCGKEIPHGKSYCKECSRKKLGFKRIFTFFSKYKSTLAVVLLLMLVEAVLVIFVPQISTKTLYDEVLNPDNTLGYEQLIKALMVTVGTIAGIKVFNLVIKIVYQYTTESLLPKIIYSIKNEIFAAMQKLSLGFFTSRQTGTLMERVTRDSNNIYFFMVDGMPGVITNVIKVVGITAIIFMMNWKLAAMLFLGVPIIILFIMLFNKKLRMIHHRLWLRRTAISSSVNDKINGHRIIKTFAKEDEESADFKNKSDDLSEAQVYSKKVESFVFPFYSVALFLIGGFILFAGGTMVLRGEMSVGTLMSFIVYIEMIREPAEFMSWVFNWWERCLDSSQRVFEIIDAKPDVIESDKPEILPDIKGEIRIENLDFEYETGRPVIKNINLKIEAGTMVGIVGKTGAGKSTIANLIARLYDAKSGSIFIDGTDVRNLTFSQLRKNVGMVSQDIFLFMGTIADNIRYSKPDATFEEVVAAAKAAHAHDFIMSLPDAYETRVGSGGQGLSGGERQRISIARAIMQNPKILILDEATAAMDTNTERKIQQSISELKKGRTTIAIAHRLSTLKDADKIAVISNGEIVEYGTFEELIKLKGEYYNLYKIQNDLRKQMALGTED